MAAASVDVTASMDFSGGLTIDFDNNTDPDVTVVTITGPDQHNLLLRLTAALNSLGLNVVSASISSSDDGTVLDVFRVTNSEDQKVSKCICTKSSCLCTYKASCCPFLLKSWVQLDLQVFRVARVTCTLCAQVPGDTWDGIRDSVLEMLAASSSRSSKPNIFGAAPAPEDQQRRQLGSAREGDAVALEVAAAEMAQAAANLVAIERSIMALTEKGVREPDRWTLLK